MFFYNQRALVFLGGAICLLAFWTLEIVVSPSVKFFKSLLMMTVFWLAAVASTIALHPVFRKRLNAWDGSPSSQSTPPLFDLYFLLDSALISILVLLGYLLDLPLSTFVFLVFANTLVYTAYIRSDHSSHKPYSAFILGLCSLGIALLPIILGKGFAEHWSSRVIIVTPVVGMLIVTFFSTAMISSLRKTEHSITRKHLELLGKYEEMLSGPSLNSLGSMKGRWEVDQKKYNEKTFRKQVQLVLEDLCSLQNRYWYTSACLWFLEEHKDRGAVYLPGPSVAFPESADCFNGISAATGFLAVEKLVVLHSMRSQVIAEKDLWRFRTDVDVPAAMIPLRRDKSFLGVLVLYGREGGPTVQRQEEAFLRSLGSIIANTMEQWEGRFRAFPQREMDHLFSCETLGEVFPGAASILQRYLFAAGCMILFREDPDRSEMTIEAASGFRGIGREAYKAGRGLTGQCAERKVIIRIDDVAAHRDEFDPELLSHLEKAHERKIVSWMVIPIGVANQKNYGVIKVVNSTFRCSWFTDYDERIAADLALRLHVIIEKFLHLKRTEDASARAKENAEAALIAQKRAENTAGQLQQDLMNITHQLQGALISVIGGLSGIKVEGLPKNSRVRLGHAQALVEDALAVAYGTFTTLARLAGRETAFGSAKINAPAELRKLCERLRLTNAREDIRFRFYEEPGFPVLTMDRNAFTSVIFSLVHNAMKYADQDSEVILECSFERSTDEAALKVKSTGEPIDPDEKETIFEKFKRGRHVEKGRHHGGVGLGLWVARELMRAVGGDLSVELSLYDSRFSVFIVHVPKPANLTYVA